MSTQQIASWTPVIVKGGVFTKQFTFTDENGALITFLSAEIDVTPNGSPAIQWTQANGLFTNVSPGVYLLSLDEAYTTALGWTSGRYVLKVVEDSGDTNPCLIEGLIFAKDC